MLGLNEKMIEYNKYKKIIPLGKTTNESPKDTLIWEFSKLIAKKISRKDTPDIGDMIRINDLVVESFLQLKIEKYVEKIKNTTL